MASPVCVTGASGAVGSWVVKALTEAGLAVRACVRDPASAKINFLRAIPNVELFHLDDVQNGAALEQAFHGCTSVCHVANPMPFGNHDPEWFVNTSVKMVETVFESAHKSGVKRIVLTATMASVCGSQREKDPQHQWSPEDWNDAPGSTYSKAKTIAEQRAWQLAKQYGIELSTIHPGLCIGPVLPGQQASSTVEWVLKIFKSIPPSPNKSGIVDLRDVGEAHARAVVQAQHGRRYLLANVDQYSTAELVRMCEAALPGLHVELAPEVASQVGVKPSTNNASAIELLGHQLITPEQSVIDALASFKHEGLL